jgi:NodT family efflux transporter outer membrane factor (OMF) lipoprotein
MRHCLLLPALLLCAGCAVGPDYAKPEAIVPATYKEVAGFIPTGWKLGEPKEGIDRGAWWSVYDDPVLDGLERQVAVSNQTLRQSEAAYREARAVVREARAGLFPTVTLTPGVTRSSSGSGSSSSSSSLSSSSFGGSSSRTRTTYSVEGAASWDPDIWGKIRRTIESDVASAQVSAADLAAATLSAQGTLAIDYFELRAADQLRTLLDDTVAQYQRALEVTQNQYDAGVAARSDVITAQTQLLSARAQAVNAGVQRATLEHAIAVLTGHAPADLTIAPTGLPLAVPVVPVSVPSALLERRPDIAAAERAMQQQNALIGVAVAAYYPDLSLSALYGYSGNPLGSLISASNRLWSLGASAAETIFDGGLRGAQVAAARAAYDGAVANYRQIVLTAFQSVEDQLSTLRILQEQAAIEADAVASARHALDIALNEYRAGTQSYTTVVTAQAILLADQQNALTVQQNRLVASATLIQNLGGGWDSSRIPDAEGLRAGK